MPTPQHRAKTIRDKNWAPRLKERHQELYHGTSWEAAEHIERYGLEPRPEWGKGFPAVYAWSDLESALNWANYWFGDEEENWDALAGGGAVVIIPPSSLEEVKWDLDPANDNWKGWKKGESIFEAFAVKSKKFTLNWNFSQSFAITNPIPPEGLQIIAGEDFHKQLKRWEKQVDEWWDFSPPYPNYVEFIGEEGPEWASYYI